MYRSGGLRSPVSMLFLCTFAILSFVAHVHAASAVLGIDLGTQNIKAALVKPGIPLEIVLTKDSKRKEVAAIAFKALKNQPNSYPERLYGGDAAALAARLPHHVYPNLKALLGKPAIEGLKYQAIHPAVQIEREDNRGTVAFTGLPIEGKADHFSVEELLAMQLLNVRDNALNLAGRLGVIEDVVITVPAFYTAEEKRAVELAANIAGLQVIGLVTDGLAVGVNYATHRTFPNAAEGGKPEMNLIYDIGAGSAKATVLQFQSKTVKDVGRFNKTIQEVSVLGTGWDRELSGNALTEVLMEHFIDAFVASPKTKSIHSATLKADIKKNGRAMAKFWKESERVRQVLSANTFTSFGVESLYEDIDFREKVTREKFEELAGHLFEKVNGPILRALQSAKLEVTDLNSIILHGGVVRTPTVQRQLEGLIEDPEKVRTNVNADEAATFGAAFRGASLSTSFRVKEIRVLDSTGYGVSLLWAGEGGKERSQVVFLPTSKPGAVKQIPFKKQEDFTFRLAQTIPQDPSGAPETSVPILEIKTLNLTASVANLTKHYGCDPSEISTKFALRLSERDILPEAIYGTVSCEVDADKPSLVEGVKGLFGFGGKKEQEPLQETPDETLPTLSEAAVETNTSSTPADATLPAGIANENATSEDPALAKKAEEPKKKTVTHYIQFQTSVLGIPALPAEELVKVQKRIGAFDDADRTRHARDEVRNVLEGFVYKALEEVEDEAFIKVSTDAERSALKELLDFTSDWLYGDGAGAPKEELDERLAKLRGMHAPVKTRQSELKERPQLLKNLRDALNSSSQYLDVIRSYLDAAKEAAKESVLPSSETSSVSTVPESAQPSSSSSTDEFAELEDNTTATSTVPPATSTLDVPIPTPSFTQEDLTSFGGLYDEITGWLKDKLAAQEQLADNVDPAFVGKEIAQKTEQITAAFRSILERQFRQPPPPKKPKTKKSKTSSAKKAKSTTKTDDDDDLPVIDVKPGEDVEEAIKKWEAEQAKKEQAEKKAGKKAGKTDSKKSSKKDPKKSSKKDTKKDKKAKDTAKAGQPTREVHEDL